MQLYTVELQNKHVISLFDAKGKKVGEKIEIIKQVIRDLPWSTVAMYKEKTNGACIVAAQFDEAPRDQQRSSRSSRHASSRDSKPATASPVRSTVQRAAETGNLAAAINAGEK